MNKIIFLVLFTISSVSCAQDNSSISVINIDMLKQFVIGENVQFVDIRTPKEYSEGFIDDAINISSADNANFIQEFEKLDKNKPIYIYCYSGWRSGHASKKLAAIGFKKIFDFKGGYKAWIRQ